MTIETLGAALEQINRLFAGQSITGFSDSQLLDRFVAARDGQAFEALVARHGPLVLNVCRGILKDPNDAEDAFQATFLILVKKSDTFRGPVALGPWLYQVAFRVAIRANAVALRRRICERRAGEMAAATSKSEPALHDEQWKPLHEELARLPEKFRRPLVLCDLQRVPQDRAARDLSLSQRTLQRRLSAGRVRLKARLIRRGLVPAGAAILTSTVFPEAQAAVPPEWGEAIVRAALAMVNHTTTAGIVSASARELTHSVARTLLLHTVAMASTSLLAAGLVAWGAFAMLTSLSDDASEKTTEAPDSVVARRADTVVPQPGQQTPETPGKVRIRGRVVGPEKQPVSGAKLYATVSHGFRREPFPAAESAKTAPDGRFDFTVPKSASDDDKPVVAAMAADSGVAWADVPTDAHDGEFTLQLVRDLPLNGEIIDLEGKPVKGALLRVLEISAVPSNVLGFWLKSPDDLKESVQARFEKEAGPVDVIDVSAFVLTAKTDADGRFKISGVGHNRTVRLQIDGPAIASQYVEVVTLPGVPIAGKFQRKLGSTTYYGSYFRHVAAPTKPVVGMVRDKDTRQPLAGFTVESNKLANDPVPGRNIVQTATDELGRYRLSGLPKGEGNKIRLLPRGDEPYLSVHALVPDTPGLDAVTVDFEVKRGIWIEGKVTDKHTSEPVQAYVDYFALAKNPNIRDHPGFDGTIAPTWGVATKADGSFRLVGLPGPGLIAVFYTGQHLPAQHRDDEYGSTEPFIDAAPRSLGLLRNYTALARIDPAVGARSIKRDVTLDPGSTFKGRLEAPDGSPLIGARSFGLTDRDDGQTVLKNAGFTVWAFDPRRPRDVFFQHPEKGLVGMLEPPKETGGTVLVKMKPGSTISGRLVDADGKPRADMKMKVRFRLRGNALHLDSADFFSNHIATDRDGRFRAVGLLPGHEFSLKDYESGELPLGKAPAPGQTKDIGDVRMNMWPR